MIKTRKQQIKTRGLTSLATTLAIALTVTLAVTLAVVAAAPTISAKTLTIHMIANENGYGYLMENVVPKFEAEHNVNVDIIRVSWGDWMDKLAVTTAGGVPPDIFMSGAEQLPELVEAGLVAPIDHFLADWPDLDDFFPPSLGSSTFEGIHYGLPIYTSPRPFWYRMDLFEQAGLDPHHPPTNWDELLQAARLLTRTEDQRVVQQGFDLYRLNSTTNNQNLQEFSIFLYQNAGRLFDPTTYKADFANPAGFETMEFMKDLRNAVLPTGYTIDPGGGQGNPLFRGAAAIRIDTSNVIRDFYNPNLDLSRADDVRAIIPPPGKENPVTIVFSDWFGIHAGSPNKDLAWEFMKLFHSADVLRDYGLAAGYQSPRRSTFLAFTEEQPIVRYVYETMVHAVPYPHFPSSRTLLVPVFGTEYRKALNSEAAVQSTLTEIARRWDAYLEE